MDIELDTPVFEHGREAAIVAMWPSVVAVAKAMPPPDNISYRPALDYYRRNQSDMAVLWADTEKGKAVYRLMGEDNIETFGGDWRLTDRGEFELVGVWVASDNDTDGGSQVPVNAPEAPPSNDPALVG